MTSRLAIVLSLLGRGYPWPVDTSGELGRALAFVGAEVDAATVVRAGYVMGALAAFAGTAVALVLSLSPTTVPLVAAALGLGVTHAVHVAPGALASARRTAALGDAPDLVGRAVLRMHVEPAAERAAAFAAETDDGPLARSLAGHVRRARGAPGSGLGSFADEWGAEFPALRRALHLVDAAADAPPGERGRTLDRAMTAVTRGTRDRMDEFGARIQGPATGIYAFGVLLPLALVAVLPAARVAGVPVTVGVLVLVYDVALPCCLLGASAWLFARRPVAFPPPSVPRSHPDVPDRPWRALVGGLGAGVGGAALAGIVAPPWTPPLVGIAMGAGVALLVRYRPIASVRDHARAVEADLVDALYLVGRRVSEGTAVESAVERAAAEVEGETGETFATAASRQRQLRVGVERAFLGDHGALADVPSPRARGTATLLGLASEEGAPAGRALVSMADHLADLQALERDCRTDLARVTGTLASTATTFGPLVAGATVALAAGMGIDGSTGAAGLGGAGAGGSATGVPPLPTADLGIVVGVYVCLLAVVLTVLSTGLRHGLDRALVGLHVGRALPTAVCVYVGSVVAAGVVV
ncbi:type II secretion system protein [Haloarchaeobius salinus]|uniref:type II secretion system protein n=1 Tax=Haloarchaeobius salinus TaxID=1198298 RepID=UPI00210D4E69